MKAIVGLLVVAAALSLSTAQVGAAPAGTAKQQSATPLVRLAQGGYVYGGPPPACPNGYYWSCRPIYPGEPYCACWPSAPSWPYIYGPYR